MGQIRPFVEGDIPRVAHLHRTAFNTGTRADASLLDSYHAYFQNVFLDNPSRDTMLPSLVCEDGDRIVGFLGVVPRRMTMNGHRIQAAISSQFVVDRSHGGAGIAVRLARAFFQGPQDLSISDEASDVSRKIWEGFGGITVLLRSLHWTRPLRPAALALATMRGRARLAPLARSARPVAAMVDAVATHLPHSHFLQTKPEGSEAEDLTEEAVLSYLPHFDRPGSLRVEYDESTLHWLLDRARRRRTRGTLHAAVVRSESRILGWYLYHLDPERVANVLHIAAEAATIRTVLDQLVYQSTALGAIAATGRVEPRFLQALSDKYCLFHRRGPWVLVKTDRHDLIRSFETEDAMFSRFEGQWCLGY
jgi:hypothetical protein